MESEYEVVISAPTADEAAILGLARLGLTRVDAEVEVLDEGSKGFLGIGMREARVRVRRRIQPEGASPVSPVHLAPDAERESTGVQLTSQLLPGSSLEPGGSPVKKHPLEDTAKKVKAEKSYAEGPGSEKPLGVKPSVPAPTDVERASAVKEDADAALEAGTKVEERSAIEALVLEVAERLFEGLDLQVTADWRDDDRRTLWVSVRGKDADVLVGPHAQTLDSVQYLLRTVVRHKAHRFGRADREFDLVLDADGYRERRLRSLATLARTMAEKVVKQGKPIQLRPMSAADRRVIHITLHDDSRVRTQSTGGGHSRAVTIFPAEHDE